MKYIIMCAGNYAMWKVPKQLTRINREPLVVRTTRLLVECGVDEKDITVTASKETAQDFMRYCNNVRIYNPNEYNVKAYNDFTGYWCDCFVPVEEPTTFLCGDVVFSPEAIKKIVETETNDIEFFASAPPFAKNYSKKWAEPFAFKIVNIDHLKQAQIHTKTLYRAGEFKRKPIAWEFWQVVKCTELNKIDYTNYTVINDYTCDIDEPEDIKKFEGAGLWHTT